MFTLICDLFEAELITEMNNLYFAATFLRKFEELPIQDF